MKTELLVISALFALPACGPGISKEDGDGSGTEDGPADGPDDGPGDDSMLDAEGSEGPVQTQCLFGDTLYEDGDTFDSPDGCVSYECVVGTINIVDSSLVTIAGDLALSTQEEVDAQTCLNVVEGNLTVTGTAASFTTLAQLARVGGNLTISASEAVSLEGFGALGEIGQSVVIADNPNLTTMAFQPYMSVFGDVTIQNNDVLTTLSGAEFIGQCGACAAVDGSVGGLAPAPRAFGAEGSGDEEPGGGAPAGDEGPGEPQGGTFYGNILIADNDLLADVNAMSNLFFAWADVRFRNNPALASLATMQLSEVQGDLEISGHVSMDDVEAQNFAAAIDVWGTTMVCGNLGGVDCPE
ncbi:MAG: hypothetical protein AAF721_27220 [Myxococcota bacterium]